MDQPINKYQNFSRINYQFLKRNDKNMTDWLTHGWRQIDSAMAKRRVTKKRRHFYIWAVKEAIKHGAISSANCITHWWPPWNYLSFFSSQMLLSFWSSPFFISLSTNQHSRTGIIRSYRSINLFRMQIKSNWILLFRMKVSVVEHLYCNVQLNLYSA